MSGVEMTRLLSEMRQLAATAESRPEQATGTSGFADLLKASIEAVNDTQNTASEMAAAFERGESSVALPEVMVALQKASLSFQAMTEVRNRLVTAYQEVMNMPI
jgi:flagellar hook-basal body complex protein FliE